MHHWLSNTSTGQHRLPAGQIQVVSRGNSRKHLGFVPSSINTALSPCRTQVTGSAGFYHPQRLRFHFLIFLLTWRKASSVKQACLAQAGCTGKGFKGEQCEIRSSSAEHSPHAGWSSPSPGSVPCRTQTVPVWPVLHVLLAHCHLCSPRVPLPGLASCKITPASSLSCDNLSQSTQHRGSQARLLLL